MTYSPWGCQRTDESGECRDSTSRHSCCGWADQQVCDIAGAYGFTVTNNLMAEMNANKIPAIAKPVATR
jgi:hypothetical protein